MKFDLEHANSRADMMVQHIENEPIRAVIRNILFTTDLYEAIIEDDATTEASRENMKAQLRGFAIVMDTIETADPESYRAYRFQLTYNDTGTTKQAAERQARAEALEANWKRKGLERCDRCGGYGGSNAWPGFTCYDCGGVGATPING